MPASPAASRRRRAHRSVLMIGSEGVPFSKTGGLADMAAALARSLARAGTRVSLVTPLHRGIRERFPTLKHFDYQLDLPLGATRVQAQVQHLAWMPGLDVYFIEQPALFDRKELYQVEGESYADNAARFVFLSKCVAQMARYLPARPDIVHAHDWQTALVPLLMLHQKWREGWGSSTSD